jgi:hypothetical protein
MEFSLVSVWIWQSRPAILANSFLSDKLLDDILLRHCARRAWRGVRKSVQNSRRLA